MIGLILLYFAGKAFYVLAENNGKSKWPFAILGVVSYYLGLFIGGMIIGICYEVFMEGSVEDLEDINATLLGLLAIPVGVLTCWGFYKFLENRWSKKETFSTSEDVLDANLVDQQRSETL
jgi:hypothetical protein